MLEQATLIASQSRVTSWPLKARALQANLKLKSCFVYICLGAGALRLDNDHLCCCAPPMMMWVACASPTVWFQYHVTLLVRWQRELWPVANNFNLLSGIILETARTQGHVIQCCAPENHAGITLCEQRIYAGMEMMLRLGTCHPHLCHVIMWSCAPKNAQHWFRCVCQDNSSYGCLLAAGAKGCVRLLRRYLLFAICTHQLLYVHWRLPYTNSQMWQVDGMVGESSKGCAHLCQCVCPS